MTRRPFNAPLGRRDSTLGRLSDRVLSYIYREVSKGGGEPLLTESIRLALSHS